MMQAPSSRIPPIRAAAVSSDLYKPCACLLAQSSADSPPTAIGKLLQAIRGSNG